MWCTPEAFPQGDPDTGSFCLGWDLGRPAVTATCSGMASSSQRVTLNTGLGVIDCPTTETETETPQALRLQSWGICPSCGSTMGPSNLRTPETQVRTQGNRGKTFSTRGDEEWCGGRTEGRMKLGRQ